MSQSASTFRDLHHTTTVLRLANAWDAGSARLVQSLGAPAVATTSAGVAWAQGYADGGPMPADVAIAAAQNIARVVSVPLSVDLENGYSDDPAVVAGYVLQLIDSGVAGINLEDAAGAPAQLAAKVEAIKAAAAKAGGDIFVNVRTDVYLFGLKPEGERLAEVLVRAELYREAGADGLFVPAITAPEEIREVVGSAKLPLNVLDVPGLPSVAELGALGVSRLSAGSGIASTLWGAARELAQSFLAGTAAPAMPPAMDYGQMQQLFATD